MHSRATDRRSASKCQGKWPDQTLDQAFGLPEVLVAVSTSRLSCKRAGKTRTLMPVWDSSGESRLRIDLDLGARIALATIDVPDFNSFTIVRERAGSRKTGWQRETRWQNVSPTQKRR